MSVPGSARHAFRGSILHFLADPGEGDAAHAYEFFEDGLLLVEHGRVQAIGHYAALY